ncbi:DUF551 domain-containing protein [Enterobacter hormaechei]|uniref:DUF551 domain-containing protein n=1 Tax=Enterobacter hormaechei TaxID=158836 RepID=UPI00298BDF43|nr:DUF551 domain-containing protein [Enterobacter hormaechei]
MSTITKEQIEQYANAARLIQVSDFDKGKLITIAPEHMLDLARIALASLEAEIHSYTFEDDPRPLYTAPPAPVDKNPLREFAREYIESWELGMAGDSSLLASARKAIADSEILQQAPVSVPDDYFSSLVAAARVRADKAMRKFPQPNYVLNKVAEESGEVIKAVIHFTEGREEWQNVEGEIIDNLAMLIRLVMEGDQVIGFTPPDACRAAMLQGAENAESPTTMKTAPALDSSPKIAESPSGNYPVIQDGWVACSERMPEESGRYWCYVEEQNDLGKSHYQWNCSWNGDRWWVESENGGRVTHWMPLPAAPQQEVKP